MWNGQSVTLRCCVRLLPYLYRPLTITAIVKVILLLIYEHSDNCVPHIDVHGGYYGSVVVMRMHPVGKMDNIYTLQKHIHIETTI